MPSSGQTMSTWLKGVFSPSLLFLFHLLATINANTNRFARTQYWSISVLTQRSKSDWFCKEIRWLFSQRLWIFLGIIVSNCLFMKQCEKVLKSFVSKRFDKWERMLCLRWSYPGHTFLNPLQMHSHTYPTLQGSWTHITQNNELSFYTLMPTFWLLFWTFLFLCSRSDTDEKQLLVRGAVYLEPHCQVILAIWPLGSVLGWYSV